MDRPVDSGPLVPDGATECRHPKTHGESDYLGVSIGASYFEVCDTCGEVVPGSGRIGFYWTPPPAR